VVIKQLPKRLLSIDVLRALTMLLMIFVNDASGVSHIPAWLDHAKESEDALGFADTIFPAFLFIAGLSIPLAIKSRISKGDTMWQVIFYIVSRSTALLIMGFYHVNLEDYSPAALLPRAVWEILITLSFFMIWLDYPETITKAKKYTLMGIGLAMLITLAVIYKGGDMAHPKWMHTSWWGILGIIGWSYLICALIYLFTKGNLKLLILLWVLFAAVNIACHGLVDNDLPIIGDASSVVLTMGGMVTIGLYAQLVKTEKTQRLWLIFTLLGILLIAGGLLIRPYTEGISKIRSTPAWIFISSGVTILMFEFFIYLIDIKGKISWFKLIRPAGTSTLTCYLIPYFQVALLELLNISYPSIFNSGIIGLMRSMATALIIIWLVGFMEKRRLRLKI
jgi:heparan-alpha-glucosaminide N-acetyltransferase